MIEDYLQPDKMYLHFPFGCIAEGQACIKVQAINVSFDVTSDALNPLDLVSNSHLTQEGV